MDMGWLISYLWIPGLLGQNHFWYYLSHLFRHVQCMIFRVFPHSVDI